MGFSTIETRVNGARGELVLNRPQKLNALDHNTLVELAEAAPAGSTAGPRSRWWS